MTRVETPAESGRGDAGMRRDNGGLLVAACCLLAALCGYAAGWAARDPGKPPAPVTVTVCVERPADVAPTLRGLLPALADLRPAERRP